MIRGPQTVNTASMSDPVLVREDGTLTIGSTTDHDFNLHRIVNLGTVFGTAGGLRSGSSGSIVNAGTWNDSASSVMNNDYLGAVWTFTNHGTLTVNSNGAESAATIGPTRPLVPSAAMKPSMLMGRMPGRA